MYEKITTILLFIFFFTFAIHAQNTDFSGKKFLTGKIITSDNRPVPDITVAIKGTSYRYITKEDGSFIFSLPSGNYIMVIQSAEMENKEVPVEVKTEQTTVMPPITLKETSRQLQEVVVTGQYMPQSLRNSVYRVHVIDQQTIRLRNATDILGVLNNELGVRFSTDLTLGETDVQIMGMSGQNVKVLLDGIPLVDRGSTKQSLSQIDINSVERIEMVEGPMSVMYGTDALAGVINIITKKNSAKDQFSIGAQVQEETVGKEYNALTGKGMHNENIHLGRSWKKWYVNGSLTRNNFGGWQGEDTGRAKEWLPKDQWIGSGTIGYHTGKTNTWYRLDYLDETIHSLGNINPNTFLATDQNYTTNRYTHQAQIDWRPGNQWSFNGSASYQDYTRTTQTTTLNTKTGDRRLSLGEGEQDVSKFNTLFFRGTAQYLLSPKVSLQSGVEFKQDNASGERIEGSPTINDYSLFVSSEIKPKAKINIRPGIRFSKNSIYDAPPVIPSLNTKFTFAKNWDLRLSYGRGFRAPALRELYFSFFDANHSIEGNPDLKAEYSNSFNGSVNWQAINSSSLVIDAALSGFYNDFNNRIDLALGADPSNPNVYTYINIAKYKTTGSTWENTIRWNHLKATVGASYIGRYNEYSKDPNYDKSGALPEFVWSAEVNSNIMYTIEKAGIQLGLFYKYAGKLPLYELATVDNQQIVHLTQTGAYHWMDINAGKTINKYLTLSAGIKNLFNVTRLQNSSLDLGSAHSTGGPVPMSYGRSVFVGLKFNYLKN